MHRHQLEHCFPTRCWRNLTQLPRRALRRLPPPCDLLEIHDLSLVRYERGPPRQFTLPTGTAERRRLAGLDAGLEFNWQVVGPRTFPCHTSRGGEVPTSGVLAPEGLSPTPAGAASRGRPGAGRARWAPRGPQAPSPAPHPPTPAPLPGHNRPPPSRGAAAPTP